MVERPAEAGAARLIDRGARTRVDDGIDAVALGDLAQGASCFGPSCLDRSGVGSGGRSVLLATARQALSAAALVELDGLARRITLALPDTSADDLRAFIADAAVDPIATAAPDSFAGFGPDLVRATSPRLPLRASPECATRNGCSPPRVSPAGPSSSFIPWPR